MTKDDLMQMAREAGIQAGFDYEFRGGYEDMPILEKESVMQIVRFANAILERAAKALDKKDQPGKTPWIFQFPSDEVRALKIPEGE